MKPKKHLGQNFLIDQNIQKKIIKESGLRPDETVLEIGLGKGVLTKLMAQRVKDVMVIEKDIDLINAFSYNVPGGNILLIHDDVLAYDFGGLPEKIKVVSNLPYNISTPVIEKIIRYRHKFSCAFLTVQLEHAQRISAIPDTKAYGSFSCFVQYCAQIKKMFKIKSTAFSPKPKVESCFFSMTFYENMPYLSEDEEFLFRLIRNAFNQRRKTIINALSGTVDKKGLIETMADLKINERARAENLSVEEFVILSNRLKRKMEGTKNNA